MKLGVNIDHVATLRQARYTGESTELIPEPSVLQAAWAAREGGADSITLHVREDRRHMQDADARNVRREIPLPLNLEMGATETMLEFAVGLHPDYVCLVPEKRQEVTTEGGLDVLSRPDFMHHLVKQLTQAGCRVSMFIDPELDQVEASAVAGAPMVEFHTGRFANAGGAQHKQELQRLVQAATRAYELGLEIHAGHGIRISHLPELMQVPHLTELNIGHTIISRAIFVGMTAAVREMKEAMQSICWES